MITMDEVIEEALKSKALNVYKYIQDKLHAQGYPMDKQYVERRLEEG